MLALSICFTLSKVRLMQKAKLLKYSAVEVDKVFEKETEILAQLQHGEMDRALILWQARTPSIVLPAGAKWPSQEAVSQALNEFQWQLYSRKTGGAPVPQCEGVLNVSYMYVWDDNTPYSITQAYTSFCKRLAAFFAHYGIKADVHATPGSYCDGDYNLNISGQKVVGTAQRVVLKKGGGKVVLAQACILVDVDIQEIITPVNLCYALHDKQERIDPNVHTYLAKHLQILPELNDFYQTLVSVFSAAEEFS